MNNFNPATLRNDFPILARTINGFPLVYFDNAATTQKPKIMIEALLNYYTTHNATAYRSIHALSAETTELLEITRDKVKKFLNARFAHECLWTKGATESINLIASCLQSQISAQDTIAVTILEHHSNFVPWQQLCLKKEANLLIIPINEQGIVDLELCQKYFSPKIKLLAITHVSNTLGTINPLKEIIKLARKYDILVVVDGAQAGAHLAIDVQDLDCDFYVLAAHKMFGPTGLGVLYGKEKWLELLPPYQTGGHMVLDVTEKSTTFNALPYKFEAGTPPLSAIVAFGATLDYLEQLPRQLICEYEKTLAQKLYARLTEISGLKILNPVNNQIPIISFTLKQMHPHDIASIVNNFGIALRAGHHCTLPLLKYLQVNATARVSLAMYNTLAEIDQLYHALLQTTKILKTQ